MILFISNFNKMKSFLKKFILFISITLALSYVAYFLLNAFQSSYYKTSLKTRWAIELTDKHVDYLLLGSSRMANMIASSEFDSLLHTTSINLATSGSSYGESYVLFQQYLAHGNTAKKLVLSFDLFKSRHIDFKAEASTPLIFKHFDFFPYEDVPEIKSVYNSYTSPWHMHLWKYVSFSRYAEFNYYFKVDSMLQFMINGKPQQPVFNRATGEQLIYNFTFKGEKIALPGAVQIGPRSEMYLLKILTLAKQHNISIVLVTAPYYKMKPFDRSTHNVYVDFLKEKFNVRYIDFTASKEWNKYRYFSDPIHTNINGSRLYTRMLCDSLQLR
jgi:hypothetical protein